MWTETSEAERISQGFGARPEPPATWLRDIRGFDSSQRDEAWSLPDGELGLPDRSPQGRPRLGGVGQGRRKRRDKGGAGARGAKAGGTGKRSWAGLWGAAQADRMVRPGRALGSVALLDVLW